MKLSHFFLPHPQTHKKAHLLSINALVIYILLFLGLQFGFSALSKSYPGVLGIASNIDQQEVIRLTNIEREKNGLGPVAENSKLNVAAMEKAKNMFEENYWSHYAPSGKDPWGFFSRAGYKFSYAGENLARNFYTSQEVVDAWMASPSHRENILNGNYQEIGIAVLNGVLSGTETTLVVQEFGTPVEAVAQAPKPIPTPTTAIARNVQALAQAESPSPTPTEIVEVDVTPPVLAEPNPVVAVAGQKQVQNNFLIDPYLTLKSFGFGVIGFLIILIIIDLYIIRRRGILRITSHHLPHLAMLSAAASVLYNMEPGSILDGVSMFIY